MLHVLSCVAALAVGAPSEADAYRPLVQTEVGGFQLELPLLFSSTVDGGGDFAVDRDGQTFAGDPAVGPRVRLGLLARSTTLVDRATLTFEYEHDLFGGFVVGRPELVGYQLPTSADLTTFPRKAYLQLATQAGWHLFGGLTMSQSGLGLFANDGGRGWTPWGQVFSDPRAGDRVLRLAAAVGPATDLGAFFTLAGDYVISDDLIEPGDDAFQLTFRGEVGKLKPTNGSLSLTYRHQSGVEGARLDALVVGVFGETRFTQGAAAYYVGAEAVGVFGSAALVPLPPHPTQAVRQLGAALKAGIDLGKLSLQLDAVVASGDEDPNDDQLTGYRTDSSFGFGLVLFRRVLAAQTGRAVASASNPALVGRGIVGIDRVATRGAVTNTFAIFPRLALQLVDGLEFSAGPMFAFALATPMDPFNSRIAGGSPRNALDGSPGRFWGTEVDFALRYRRLLGTSELLLGVEGGVLIPGSALAGAGDVPIDSIPAGRAVVQLRL
jgi:hypothetical protein